MAWQNGRRLTSVTTGGKTTTYAYDANGIRTTKVVGGVTHEYLTLNGKVVYEKIGTGATAKIMVFTYDAQGRPFAVKYSKNNGESFTNYFYALNLQGDVVKIFRPNAVKDADGTTIGYTERTYATYSYNAWCELIGITDSNGNSILNKQTTSTALANLNPLRYRGYYYDNETGFYYLQSRYYDPANHRFINADIFTSTDETDSISCNMFAYCGNNPVMNSDPDGRLFGLACLIVGACALIGAGLGAANAASTGGDVLEGAVEGFLTGAAGAICGLTLSPIGAFIIGGISGGAIDFSVQAASQYIRTDTVDFSDIDWKRTIKTSVQTGVGAAIPSFGGGSANAVDAIGTALIWSECSTLITCTDIISENLSKHSAARRDANRNNGSARNAAVTWKLLF